MDLVWFADRLEKSYIGPDYVKARCIFHDDRDPSLVIYERTKRYECLGCGASGTWSYLRKVILRGRPDKSDNFDSQSYEIKGNRGFIIRPSWEASSLSEYFEQSFAALRSIGSATTYLEDRGLVLCIRRKWVGWDNGWYVVPIRSRSMEILGAVARAGPTRERQGMKMDMLAGQKSMLYVPDWELVDGSDKLYIVFGIFDAMSLAINGIPVASPSSGQLSLRTSWFDDINHPIILLPDRREEKKAFEYAAQLDWRGRVQLIDYPYDSKDCNDILVKHGVEALKHALDQSK